MCNLKYLFSFFFFINSAFLFCQNKTDENLTKITTVLDNYFDLEREAIHLHLDKTTFLNNETYDGSLENIENRPDQTWSGLFL